MISRPSPGFRRLAVATAVATYLLIVWGGIVRVTGSGNGCGTQDQWPLCHGSLLPAWQINTLIEFTHRWIASVCTLLVMTVERVPLAELLENRGRVYGFKWDSRSRRRR